MGISEAKKQIVIDNYFKNTCDVNTSIKEAFTKGFEVGLTKAVFPKDQYENRLKADMVAILDKVRAEIKALSPKPTAYDVVDGNLVKDAVWETLIEVDKIIDKYKTESEPQESEDT